MKRPFAVLAAYGMAIEAHLYRNFPTPTPNAGRPSAGQAEARPHSGHVAKALCGTGFSLFVVARTAYRPATSSAFGRREAAAIMARKSAR